VTDGAADDLDDLIRRVDPDRWLTSRFVGDAAARGELIALYAYDHELARARRVASRPLLAEIRLTWWREALDEIYEARPVRRHPTAEALGAAVRRHSLPRAPLEAMIDGQIDALDVARFDAPAAVAWANTVEGSAAQLAAMVLSASAPAAAAPAGGAWGLALLIRAGLADREALAAPLREALAQARAAATALDAAAFPAALPARLARHALDARQPGPLAKRLALVLATATGRL
jgi:phytoene synthase